MSWDSLSTPVSNSALRFSKTPSTSFKLVMTDPISLSWSARPLVKSAVCARMASIDPPCPLQHLHQRLRQGVDLLGVHRLEQRSEAADECVEIQCGARVGDRDERPVRQRRDGALAPP